MKIESPSIRIPFLFVSLLAVLLLTSLTAFGDARVQFIPTSGTASLMGSAWKNLSFPGTVAAVTGTFTGVDTTVSSSGSLSVTVSGGTSSSVNTQAQYSRNQSAVTVAGSGGFTEGPLYQSYGGYNSSGGASLWLSLSKVQPSTWFLVELYAYDNSNNGGMVFADMTNGSAATSGSLTYTAGSTFTTNSDADNRFSVVLAVQSDTTGNILIKGLPTGGNANAILNGFRISSKWIPKVYVPTLNPTERVVAAVTPQQFGAKGDGVTDDTAAFQNAINFVYHTGTRAGGVVYVPNATYAFSGTLSLPVGVTLHGDWTNWTSGTTGATGATFAIYSTGTAATPGFLNCAGNDAVIGINFWYPNQNPSNITSYPYTINCSAGCALQEIVLINSYQGINMYGNEYSFRGVYGSPLAAGIQVDGGADWANMADINFSPAVWVASKLANAPSSANGPHAAWMRNYGTGLILMRIDGINCIQTNVSGYNVGINMSQSTGGSISGVSMPAFYSGTIQNCNTGIMANFMPGQQGLQLTNMTINGATAIAHTSVSGFFIHLENCQVTGTGGTAVYINSDGSNDWSDFFQAQDCTFNGTVNPNSGVTDFVNCTLNSGTQCLIGGSVCKASFAGCTFTPSQKIVNNAGSSALLVSSTGATLLDSSTGARIISQGITWANIFSAYQACQPARQDLYVATDYGAMGNGTNDDTSAIQAALSAAAGNGGGIVYLPGGHYKTSGSLTVATGVELRGVCELRHAVGRWPDGYCKASVVQPTAGAGGTSGPPAVILSATSGIRGVDFSYETQTPVAPVAYPPTIQGQGANVYVIAGDFPNTWIGVDLDSYSCPNHYCSMIYGVTLNTFFKIGNGSSGYVVDTEAQTSYWDGLDDTKSPLSAENGALIGTLEAVTLATATVHWWGNCTETVAINPSINDNIAVDCASENGRGPTVTGVVQTNDISNYSFYLESQGPSNISLANSWLVTVTSPIHSTSSNQGVFRLFNATFISNNYTDFSISGGDVGIQEAYFQLYSPLGAQVTGSSVFALINSCTYINTINVGGASDFAPYVINISGPGVTGSTSRVVGAFSYNGFAMSINPSSLGSAWANFSRYANPSFPYIPQTGLVATGSMGSSFNYPLFASNSPTSYSASPLPAGLSVNTTTGLITGTPTVAGSTNVVLTAYNAGGSGTAGLVINILPPPPAITGTLTATGTQWNGFSYQIAGTNSPTSFTATGLPSGLSLNATTGMISGVPAVVGTSSVQITAADAGGGSVPATLTLIIQPAPLSISSSLSATGTDRNGFSYQIAANNSPTGYSVASLPAGMSFDTSTGMISGTPTATGTFSVIISAFNLSGTGSAILTFIVDLASPLITSPPNVTGTNGVGFTYQIQASDSPTGFSATGLPSGLTVSASSGLISGTVKTTGTTTAAIIASNPVGTGSAALVIGILPPPPAAPTGLTATSGSNQVSLAWNTSTGAASYNVSRSVTAGTGFVNVGNVTSNNFVDTGAANGTLYYYVVTALGISGVESGTSNQIAVMPGSLPSPWQWQDIAASNVGGANYSGTTFSLSACGTDIWGTSDGFGYIYQTTGTACRIIARVITMDNPASNAKAGVMIRETLAANSDFADVVLDTPTAVQNISRSTPGQSAGNNLSTNNITAPYWFKLIRSGTNFSSYISSNGTSWTMQASVNINMGATAYVGMAVCSHDTGAMCAATFDNVSVSGTLPSAPQLSNYLSPAVAYFGANLSYEITASNSPAFYLATGLPSGVSVNATTGLISGVPSAVGTNTVSISAGNDGGVTTQNLTIIVVPQSSVITGVPGLTGTYGAALNYQIVANNSPSSYAASGLPGGLSVNASSGLISGTPTAVGTFNAIVSASNAALTASANLIVTILPPAPPVITSAASITGTNGSPFDYQITAGNIPASYAASGLPAGLSVSTSTGVISGTPTATGTYSTGITASNIVGTGSTSLTITVLPTPPSITSAGSATGTNGGAFSYQITANNNPTSYGGYLPAGLRLNPSTGLITGTPTISGTFNATITAINAGGAGSAPLTITLAAVNGMVNRWTWDPLFKGNGSDGTGPWDNATAIFSNGTTDVIYSPGVVTKSVGTTAVGSNQIVVTSTTGLVAGEALSLSNFTVGTVIASVSGSTVTLSTNATSAVAGNTAVTFVDANDVDFGNGTDPAGTVTVSGTQYAGSMTINPAGSGNYTFANGMIILGTRNGSTGILTLNDSETIGAALNLKGISFAMAGLTLALNGGSSGLGNGNTIIGGTSTAISQASSIALSSGTYNTGTVMMWNIGNMTSTTGGFTIQPGGTFNQTTNLFVGYFSNNSGLMTLNGGLWNTSNGASLVLGRTYAGEALIQSGTFNAQGIITVGMNNTGVLDINGGILTSSTTLAINSGNGYGTATITGGTVSVATVDFGGGGYGGTSTSGSGALIITGGILYVGSGGIENTGSGTSTYAVTLSSGTLGASTNWSSSLPMNLASMVTAQAADVSNTSWNITLSGVLSGTGGLYKSGAGMLTLTASNTYTGGTTIGSGTLMVNDAFGSGVGSGPVTVSNGAALGGTGVIGGSVLVDGQLSPGVTGTGTLTINGSVAIGSTGFLEYGLGSASGSLKVNGNLALGGVLNVFDSGGLTTGTYGLITYTGSLTNNGLAIGSTPAKSYYYKVDTSVGGRVNLIVSSQSPIAAWKTSVFGANASTQSISGDTVINNNANITNLMAYALGENPYTIQALSLPEPILVLSNGTEYLAIQFQRNAEATDISYVVESSTSPAITGNWTPVSTFLNGGWSPAVNVIESGTPPQMNVEVSDTVPINSYPARFYHLKVIH